MTYVGLALDVVGLTLEVVETVLDVVGLAPRSLYAVSIIQRELREN